MFIRLVYFTGGEFYVDPRTVVVMEDGYIFVQGSKIKLDEFSYKRLMLYVNKNLVKGVRR